MTRTQLWACGGGVQSAAIAALIVQGKVTPDEFVIWKPGLAKGNIAGGVVVVVKDGRAISREFSTQGQAVAEAKALEASGEKDRPLFGVPVAIKDNIDAEGFATTAACPASRRAARRCACSTGRLRSCPPGGPNWSVSATPCAAPAC